MGTSSYSDEFKRDAVRGYAVREVSGRSGVSTHSLYKWIKLFGDPEPKKPGVDHEAENCRLKRELARVTEERDILRKGGRVLRAECKVKYAFMQAHRAEFSVRAMSRVLRIHVSGFCAWL